MRGLLLATLLFSPALLLSGVDLAALKKTPPEDAALYLKAIDRLEKRRLEISRSVTGLTNAVLLPVPGKPYSFAETPVKLILLPGLLDLDYQADHVYLDRVELKNLFGEYRAGLSAEVSFFHLWLSNAKTTNESVAKKLDGLLFVSSERFQKHEQGLTALREGLGL